MKHKQFHVNIKFSVSFEAAIGGRKETLGELFSALIYWP